MSFKDEIFESRTGTNRNEVKVLRIKDLLNLSEDPIKWVVDGLLIEGGVSLLASKPKSGKTTFTRSLALAVSRGQIFLERNTSQGGVLLISLEDKLSEVGRHFRSMGATAEDQIYIVGTALKGSKSFSSLIQDIQPKLVILDTLILGISEIHDINDYSLVAKALSPYIQIAREQGFHLMLLHHLAKRDRSGGDGILGSTALFGSVDAVILLERNGEHRTFSTIMRYGTDLNPQRIVLNENRNLEIAGHSVDSPELRMEESIMNVLSHHGRAIGEKEVESLVIGSTALKRTTLRKMVKSGQVMRLGKGTKGNEYLYSCLHLKTEQ
nr:hypothetical protein HAGR004_03370 [Bdellovibrio sp. HAGR004]